MLEAGDTVPADCRLVETHDLTVDNAAITGESEPVSRTAEADTAGDALRARNSVHMGTDVITGMARAVVFATGQATEFGRIYRLAAAAPQQKTPLQREVAWMARRVALTALAVGLLLFAVRLPTGQGTVSSFVFALGVMVALVPGRELLAVRPALGRGQRCAGGRPDRVPHRGGHRGSGHRGPAAIEQRGRRDHRNRHHGRVEGRRPSARRRRTARGHPCGDHRSHNAGEEEIHAAYQ